MKENINPEKILNAEILKSSAFRWFLVVLWMAVIFLFSHQANSGTITEKYFGVLNVPVRKLGHLVEYMFLYMLVRWAMDGIKSSATLFNTIIALVISVLYALSDEWHQNFVAGRSACLRDVGIDSTGALAGIFVYFMLAKAKEIIVRN